MRHCRPLLFALAALSATSPASDAAAKKRRPLPAVAAKPAVDAGLRPAIGVAGGQSLALPGPGLPGAIFLPQSLAANGFAGGGLRSGLPAMGDPAAQCRGACAATRITCDDDPSTPVCASRWAICVASCNR